MRRSPHRPSSHIAGRASRIRPDDARPGRRRGAPRRCSRTEVVPVAGTAPCPPSTRCGVRQRAVDPPEPGGRKATPRRATPARGPGDDRRRAGPTAKRMQRPTDDAGTKGEDHAEVGDEQQRPEEQPGHHAEAQWACPAPPAQARGPRAHAQGADRRCRRRRPRSPATTRTATTTRNGAHRRTQRPPATAHTVVSTAATSDGHGEHRHQRRRPGAAEADGSQNLSMRTKPGGWPRMCTE